MCRDAKNALVACEKQLRLVDMTTGKVTRTYTGHGGEINSLDVSSEGAKVLTGSQDSTARLWDIESGKMLHKFSHRGGVQSVTFSPDAKVALTSCESGMSKTKAGLHLWDTENGKAINDLELDVSPNVAITRDGILGLASSADRPLMAWTLSLRPNPLPGQTPEIRGRCRLAPVGKRQVLIAGEDGRIVHWDIDTTRSLHVYEGEREPILDIVADASGRRFVSASAKTLRVWDLIARKELAAIEFATVILSVSFSREGHRVLLTDNEGHVRLLDLEKLLPRSSTPPTSPTESPWQGHTGQVNTIAFSHTGYSVLTGGEDGTVRSWNASNGALTRTFELGEPILAARFCDDAKRVFAYGMRRGGQTWNANTGDRLTTLRINGLVKNVLGADISADGRLAVAAVDTTLWLFTVKAKEPEATATERNQLSRITCVAVNPQGTLLAFGDTKGYVQVYDVASAKVVTNYLAHKGSVTCLTISGQQQRVISGGQDGSVMLRSLLNITFFRRMTGHEGPITAVGCSSDGTRIISASKDKSVRVWDGKGRQVGRLLEETMRTGVALSPDGMRMAVCGEKGILVQEVAKIDGR
jgi:WD40 repeat protein